MSETETDTTTKVEPSTLDTIIRWNHRFISSSVLEQRFKYLRFSPSAIVRMASIIGWIHGLAMAGEQEKANYFADNLFQALDYLGSGREVEHTFSRYVGDESELKEHTRKVPDSLVLLNDDGCLHSFAFTRLTYVTHERLRELNAGDPNHSIRPYPEEDVRVYGAPGANYIRFYNGGLIYSGPGQGETFTVNLSSGGNPWGVHT